MSSCGSKLQGCRVLIIEDEYFLASDLEAMLRSHGASIVGPFAELDSAYRQVKGDHFDVAIVDINLQDEKAYPIVDELIRQRIPFVFSTGYDPRVIPDRFTGVKLLQKPFGSPELVEDLALLCRR